MARAQLPIFVGVAVCTTLTPRFLLSTNMGGMSNYGVYAATTVPYSLGVLTTAMLQWRAARQPGMPRRVGVCGPIVALGLLANLATTYRYHHGGRWEFAHMSTAIALALTEFVSGIVLGTGPARQVRPRHAALAAAFLICGFTALVLTYVGLLHVLFAAELATGLGFSIAIVAAADASTPVPDEEAADVMRFGRRAVS